MSRLQSIVLVSFAVCALSTVSAYAEDPWTGLTASYASGLTAAVDYGDGRYLLFTQDGSGLYSSASGELQDLGPWGIAIDAVLRLDSDTLMVFAGAFFGRYSSSVGGMQGALEPIAGLGLPSHWDGVDAGVRWSDDWLLLFRDAEFVLVAAATLKAQPVQAMTALGTWPAGWQEGLGAVVKTGEGHLHMIRQGFYLPFDAVTQKFLAAVPAPMGPPPSPVLKPPPINIPAPPSPTPPSPAPPSPTLPAPTLLGPTPPGPTPPATPQEPSPSEVPPVTRPPQSPPPSRVPHQVPPSPAPPSRAKPQPRAKVEPKRAITLPASFAPVPSLEVDGIRFEPMASDDLGKVLRAYGDLVSAREGDRLTFFVDSGKAPSYVSVGGLHTAEWLWQHGAWQLQKWSRSLLETFVTFSQRAAEAGVEHGAQWTFRADGLEFKATLLRIDRQIAGAWETQ